MYLKEITLKNYRNITFETVLFHENKTVFFGDNGQGKTNILEAIYYMSCGRSHRTAKDKELIQFNENDAFLKIVYDDCGRTYKITIHLRNLGKKGISINDIPIKKMSELFGNFISVIFSPEDMSLINDGPSERRRYFDILLCKIDKTYYNYLSLYYHVLKQRNSLLRQIYYNKSLIDTLDVFDTQITVYGKKIIEKRQHYVEIMSKYAEKKHLSISGNKENLAIIYKSNASADTYEEKLLKNREKDIKEQKSNIGPHRDDFIFQINNFDAKIYGSQGQKKTATLSLKLSELDFIRDLTGKNPVLLLDDVLSELDFNRQDYIINHLADTQIIVTTTGDNDKNNKLLTENHTPVDNLMFSYDVKNGKYTKRDRSV